MDLKNKLLLILDNYKTTSLGDLDAVEQIINLFTTDPAAENNNWVKFDFNDLKSRPKKYGKYFVCRKDNKVHWETWNGSGWAYNGNVITHWMDVKLPKIDTRFNLLTKK